MDHEVEKQRNIYINIRISIREVTVDSFGLFFFLIGKKRQESLKNVREKIESRVFIAGPCDAVRVHVLRWWFKL